MITLQKFLHLGMVLVLCANLSVILFMQHSAMHQSCLGHAQS
jgi:hypothetical protein